MERHFFIVRLFCFMLIMMVLLPDAYAEKGIRIPNANLLSSPITKDLGSLLLGGGSPPLQVAIDIRNDIVSGVTCLYAREVPIKSLNESIMRGFPTAVLVFESETPYISSWKVLDFEMTITLIISEEGNPQLLYVKWIK